ncbi:MAG: anti-anti-sigma regulatory factor (antagonist of anti-sigma factor) [Solidesulfovibrio magneticus str. Maddingley MBC34]|uniref:Anti-anti-sigma regulatory factor (Antagonist of anti-sigma factor) n=1 Tax=Solidesulfovibrio magneticus str. Maddingley MBC34 TaxID=1206767 RepID=K6GUB9_9BACT|nr:MAG: anti-anti-sigma regulatory factor (antagonist of anti-sigma factor) [Solidesulfovibrio magneticus str. Maddingley MBC34]
MKQPQGRRTSSALYTIDGVLIAPVPVDCDDSSLHRLKGNILDTVHGGSCRSVLLDVSGLEWMDLSMYAALVETVRLVGLLGARCVFTGFQPGVVSALIDMDITGDALECVATMEEGLALLRGDRLAREAGDDDQSEALENLDDDAAELPQGSAGVQS